MAEGRPSETPTGSVGGDLAHRDLGGLREGGEIGRARRSLPARSPLAMRPFIIAGALIALGLVISSGDALAVLVG